MREYRVSKTAAADLLEIGLYTQNKWGITKPLMLFKIGSLNLPKTPYQCWQCTEMTLEKGFFSLS